MVGDGPQEIGGEAVGEGGDGEGRDAPLEGGNQEVGRAVVGGGDCSCNEREGSKRRDRPLEGEGSVLKGSYNETEERARDGIRYERSDGICYERSDGICYERSDERGPMRTFPRFEILIDFFFFFHFHARN